MRLLTGVLRGNCEYLLQKKKQQRCGTFLVLQQGYVFRNFAASPTSCCDYVWLFRIKRWVVPLKVDIQALKWPVHWAVKCHTIVGFGLPWRKLWHGPKDKLRHAGNKWRGGGAGAPSNYTVNYVKCCKFLEKWRKFP